MHRISASNYPTYMYSVNIYRIMQMIFVCCSRTPVAKFLSEMFFILLCYYHKLTLRPSDQEKFLCEYQEEDVAHETFSP